MSRGHSRRTARSWPRLLTAALVGVVWLWGIERVRGQSDPPRLKAEFIRTVPPAAMLAGEAYRVPVQLRNAGAVPWTPDIFRLSYHWVTSEGERVVRDGERTLLPGTIAPGAAAALCAVVAAPAREGRYRLEWDVVQEGVTWLSVIDRSNLFVDHVAVRTADGKRTGADLRAVAAMLAFVVVTVGHFLAVAWSLRSVALEHVEEDLFFTVVLGFGTLQAILHALAATAGISLGGGLASILVLDAVLLWWAGREATRSRTHPRRLPRAAVAGVIVLLALLLQWSGAASTSLRVAGTDAAHYHVPYAVNFAHGASLFGFAATPHLYPMGASIWGAWLLQPVDGTGLIDLMAVPAAILLFAGCALLFRVVTGQPGIVWMPWLLLLLATAPLVRLSLLPSADLFYAAAFVAMLAQCFAIWSRRSIRSVDVLGLAMACGLLLSAKTTGTVSTAAILALLGAALLGERVLSGHRVAWRATRIATILSLPALILSGGIWMIRNWIVFGSPTAPAGLKIAGVTIFPGDSLPEGAYYYSVLKDLRDIAGYDLAARFAFYAEQLLGFWFVPAAALLLLLVLDAIAGPRREEATGHIRLKIGLLAAVCILAVSHVALLMASPWTSLEWTRGLALRYVLPLLLLCVLLAAVSLFPSTLPWYRSRRARTATLIAFGGLTAVYYGRRQGIPGLPESEWFATLELMPIALSAVIVGLWSLRVRAARIAAAAVLVAVLSFGSYTTAARNDRLLSAARNEEAQEAHCAAEGVPVQNGNRCVYLQALAHESRQLAAHGRRRFFVASRFDTPFELQGVDAQNLVIDARGRTELAPMLDSEGPGAGPRDYVIIDAAEKDSGRRMAFRLALERGARRVGICGRYELYYVPPFARAD